MTIKGECFCGAINYEVGELRDAQCCHCSQCRRAFSGASSAFAAVAPGSFKWTAGEDALSKYVGQKGWGLCFCGTCGTTLAGIYEGEVKGVTLGSVMGDPGVVIKRHIFVGSKASWDDIGGDAPQHETWPPQ